MDKQIKLLNKQYLTTKLQEVKEIKRKDLTFDFEDSDRSFSKSLYINFYDRSGDGRDVKVHTLRISDHLIPNCPHTQFIISPNDYLSKKQKAKLIRTVEGCMRRGKDRFFYKEMQKLTKKVEEGEL